MTASTEGPRTRTFVQALNEALDVMMAEDERVFLLGEDIGLNGGVFRVTDGLQKRFGEDRVVDTPLSEGGIMGIGSGGNFALAAAKALMDTSQSAEDIARKAMAIAAEICVYTNRNIIIEALESV